jgi:hypothetical protein
MIKKNPFLRYPFWVMVIFITLLLCWISLYAFRLSWLTKPEEKVVQATSEVKKFINENIFSGNNGDKDFIQNHFILINTTEDAGLAQAPPEGLGAPSITSITDRAKLAKLFKWLAENDSLYKIAVCDLTFYDAALNEKDDSILRKYINLLLRKEKSKIIFAGQFDENGKNSGKSVFEDIDKNTALLGNTHYTDRGGGFIEYTLATNKNTIKSLPLLLYENTHNIYTTDGRIFNRGDREGPMGLIKLKDKDGESYRVWNNFTPEILFDAEAIDTLPSFENSKLPIDEIPCKIRLGTAAAEGEYLSILCSNNKEKIIFIGAFGGGHNDRHETLYGQADGSVILLNIYYSLATGKNIVSWLFLLFLFAVFFVLSIDIVFNGYLHNLFFYIVSIFLLLGIPKILLDGLGMISVGFKIASKEYTKWVKDESHYFILILVAIIANVFFNRIINIVIIAIAVFILYKLFKYLYGNNER